MFGVKNSLAKTDKIQLLRSEQDKDKLDNNLFKWHSKHCAQLHYNILYQIRTQLYKLFETLEAALGCKCELGQKSMLMHNYSQMLTLGFIQYEGKLLTENDGTVSGLMQAYESLVRSNSAPAAHFECIHLSVVLVFQLCGAVMCICELYVWTD